MCAHSLERAVIVCAHSLERAVIVCAHSLEGAVIVCAHSLERAVIVYTLPRVGCDRENTIRVERGDRLINITIER